MGCPYNDEVIGQDKKNSKSNSKGTVCKYGLHTWHKVSYYEHSEKILSISYYFTS